MFRYRLIQVFSRKLFAFYFQYSLFFRSTVKLTVVKEKESPSILFRHETIAATDFKTLISFNLEYDLSVTRVPPTAHTTHTSK